MFHRQDVPEIGKGVRRHRSDVLRRPRTNTQGLSSAIFGKGNSVLPREDDPSATKEALFFSPSSPHVLQNLHRDENKEAVRYEHRPATVKSLPDDLGREDVQREKLMEKCSRDVVYGRRMEAKDNKSAIRKLEAKDARKGNGKECDRTDEKQGRKRDGKDVRFGEKNDTSKFSRNGDSLDDDVESVYGSYSVFERVKRPERSWKEIAEKEGRNQILKVKHGTEKDEDERDDIDRKNSAEKKRSISIIKLKHVDTSSKPGELRLPTKLKLKVGGVVRTLHSDPSKVKDTSPGASLGGRQGDPFASSDKGRKRRHRLILQDNSDDEETYAPRMMQHHQLPEPVLDSYVSIPNHKGMAAIGDMGQDHGLQNRKELPVQGLRKSSRVPKKKVLEDYEDDLPDEGKEIDGKGLLGTGENDHGKDADYYGKGVSDKDASSVDDEDDEDLDSPKIKKQRTVELNSTPVKAKAGATLTARQRTLQISKEGEADGSSLIEFPTGLTHSRKGRERLTDEERQVRKAEAARKRKQLVEKTEKEIQATAIQKILGQDSSRKRKEEKLQKQRDEIEQGRKAAALEPASKIIRWSMGPEGTIVSWAQDVQLPSFFTSGPSRYPPAREKCAAPACQNSYKYRDSKSSLPLCSLQCYQAVQPSLPLIKA